MNIRYYISITAYIAPEKISHPYYFELLDNTSEDMLKINKWLDDNEITDFKWFGRNLCMRNESDAMLFRLTWV